MPSTLSEEAVCLPYNEDVHISGPFVGRGIWDSKRCCSPLVEKIGLCQNSHPVRTSHLLT